MTTFKKILMVLLQFLIAMSIFAVVLLGLCYVAFLLVQGLGPVWGLVAGLVVTCGVVAALNEFTIDNENQGKK